jgi:hypothetical protein
MWIVLGVLLSFSALALEPFESLKNVKILRVLPENVIVLNRGLEDGILRNDHAKISNDTNGYTSRAICLKASTDLSYWKIYRVPEAEAFSLDYVYTVSGLADREIPFPQQKLRDHAQKISGLEEKKKEEKGPDPFLVRSDLPEQLTERDLLEKTGPERRKLFIEQTFNQDQLEKDLKDFRLSLYASPFMRQSINEGESFRYGFRGGNMASKYRLLTQFEQQQTKLKDPETEETVSTRSTSGNAQFVIHRLSSSLSTLSVLNYNSQRFSSFATPRAHWQFGPVGLTWHLYDSKTWEYLDLSYVPLYDTRTTDIIGENGKRTTDKTSGLRHGFRFGMKNRINERVALENLLWVRPYQDIASWEIEGDNLNLVNDLKLIFNLSGNLFFDYNFVYQKDKLWKTLNNLPEVNTINSLNVRYDIDL